MINIRLVNNNDINYELDISKIKPKNIKKSDKYSSQIYRYIKKNPECFGIYYVSTQDIYDHESDGFVEKECDFDINNFRGDKLWLGYIERETNSKGYIDWLYGNTLSTITSSVSKNRYEIFANPWLNKKKVIDVTKEFWEHYIKVGRCVYVDHNREFCLHDEGRFEYLNDGHRKCNWCGAEEQLIKKIKTYEVNEWLAYDKIAEV